jgi:glycosyltransferase involved in cell wall biosynthesis
MAEPLSVAMLVDNHYGPDPRVRYECSLLAAAGASTRVIAWDRRASSGPRVSRTPVGGIDVVRVTAPAPMGGFRPTLRALATFCRVVWRDRRALLGDVDVLVVHDVYLLPLARVLSRSLRLPYLYDAHEDYAVMESDRLPRWWLKAATALETRLARRADAVVVPGLTRADRWVSAGIPAPVVLRNRGAGPPPNGDGPPDWDLACVSATLDPSRRPDVFLEVARRRPDLRFALAGEGPWARHVEQAARQLTNVDCLGWVDDATAVLARSRAAFYGLDPAHPYASKACPNTLFDALRARRPLIFFCGGEPEELLARFRIGIRCAPTADAVLEVLDEALDGDSWECEAALAAIDREESPQDYVAAVVAAKRGRA